jgi:hypothetical protein
MDGPTLREPDVTYKATVLDRVVRTGAINHRNAITILLSLRFLTKSSQTGKLARTLDSLVRVSRRVG